MIKIFTRQKEIRLAVILVGLSIFLIILDNFYGTLKLKSVIRTLFVVEQELHTKISLYLGKYGVGLSNLSKIVNENRKLKEEIRHLYKEKENWRQILIENERLRKIIDYKKRLHQKTILAKVTGFDPSNLFKVITINKGSKEGLFRDMEVVTFVGDKEELVGKIIEVGKYTSKVLLLLDQNSEVGVYIKRIGVNAILAGNNQCYKLNYVENDVNVQIGDEILTSGKGGIFTKDILVGRVSKIRKKKLDLFYDIEVTPTLDRSKLEEVLVVVDKNN